METVLVLGGSGMLGSMVVDVLSRNQGVKVIGTVRDAQLRERMAQRAPDIEWRIVDVLDPNRNTLQTALEGASWIINAIGMTKPYTHDDNAMEIERAIRINALLPYELGKISAGKNAKVLQIATDCTYDGIKGNYSETDPHNALDVYGKTKSLGEALLPNVYCLRSSIIGPEPKLFAFLLEWFRRQPQNGHVNGYSNHQWNGVTTYHFARICQGVIQGNMELPHIQHIIPSGTISKESMLSCFGQAYQREDVQIHATLAKTIIDRTLCTNNTDLNQKLWNAAGYLSPPTVPEMIAELAKFDYRFERI